MEGSNNINIEEIMSEIRQKIKDQNLTADMLSFEDVPYKKASQTANNPNVTLGEADTALAYLNAHSYIQPYKELQGNPLAVFIKKIIRKLTKFYVEPVVFEQNDFNANTVAVLNALKNAAGKRTDETEISLEDILGKIEVLELNQKNLLVQIEALEKENKALMQQLGKQAD